MSWWASSLIGAAPGSVALIAMSIRRDGASWPVAIGAAAVFVGIFLGAAFVFGTGVACLLHGVAR